MRMLLLLTLLFSLQTFARVLASEEIRMQQQFAKRVTIIRDRYGVPHIYGKSDADVAFGMMYAQCEDNYWQLEETYIRSLGRASELYGERELQQDAYVRLFECVKRGRSTYEKAPAFIRNLCDAGAAAINFYLYKHPQVSKRLIKHYEPWFFLVPETHRPSSHGVSGAEIRSAFALSRANSREDEAEAAGSRESGSNTIALGPSKTTSSNTMLLINPHVGFFGDGQRYEAHLVSRQGLNVSGFAIFGTFYIWSGFNQYNGWAHTNSAADFEDVYIEHFDSLNSTTYRYGDTKREAIVWFDTIPVRVNGKLQERVLRFVKTHHGPVVAVRDSLMLTLKNVTAPQDQYMLQCWNMMKSTGFKSFSKAMELRALGYPNTSYADRDGNIAYWHGNAIPKRDPKLDWRLPVDGSDPATEWQGLHPLSEIVQLVNPTSGWIENCNSTPFLAAGASSPAKENYPGYMAAEDQNFRAEEAVRLLSDPRKISFDYFQKLAVSNHLPMMEHWIPGIVSAGDKLAPANTEMHRKLNGVIEPLRSWDYRYGVNSKATTIAVAWYLKYSEWAQNRRRSSAYGSYTANLLAGNKLPAPDSVAVRLLADAADDLINDYGSYLVPWGTINRLQRVHTSGTIEKFDDKKISLPVAAVPGALGSLFAFSARAESGQKNVYGTAGNTYTALIEFGKMIKAKSIVYFGQSADPTSPHYFDQAPLYAKGKFKDVYFYRKQVRKHQERKYHPGME